MKMGAQEKKGRGEPMRKGQLASTAREMALIAAPPRVAVQGRSKADHHDDSASTKSTLDSNTSDNEDTDADSKDKKIGELKREITIMAEEFEQTLTHLSHKMTNEQEMSTFWQQKHSTLNQTFLKTDTELRILRQEVGSLQQAREDRDRDASASSICRPILDGL
jgi:hypothetical protein